MFKQLISLQILNFMVFRLFFDFRFVLNTDTTAASVKEFLQQYYAKVWVEYVVKNPLWTPGTPVTSDLFKLKSDQYIRQSSMFMAKSA